MSARWLLTIQLAVAEFGAGMWLMVTDIRTYRLVFAGFAACWLLVMVSPSWRGPGSEKGETT